MVPDENEQLVNGEEPMPEGRLYVAASTVAIAKVANKNATQRVAAERNITRNGTDPIFDILLMSVLLIFSQKRIILWMVIELDYPLFRLFPT